jgi:hypothetical protein
MRGKSQPKVGKNIGSAEDALSASVCAFPAPVCVAFTVRGGLFEPIASQFEMAVAMADTIAQERLAA